MIGYLQVQRVVDACGMYVLDGGPEFDSDLPGFEVICSVHQFCFVRLAKVWSNYSKVVRSYGHGSVYYVEGIVSWHGESGDLSPFSWYYLLFGDSASCGIFCVCFLPCQV